MKQETLRRIRLICSVLLSLSALVAGVCLIIACYGIYAAGGEQPFTYGTVGQAFAPIAIPVYLCIALAAVSIALHILFPEADKEPPLRNQPGMTLRRLKKRRVLTADAPEIQAAVRKEQTLRRNLYILCAVVFAICAGIFLAYALNGEHFHQTQINQSMIRAMYVLLPCLGVSLAVGLPVCYRCRASMVAEGELWKQCPKRQQPCPEKTAPERLVAVMKAGAVVLAAALLIYGFLSGGTADVLTKAVNICTECVGLG